MKVQVTAVVCRTLVRSVELEFELDIADGTSEEEIDSVAGNRALELAKSAATTEWDEQDDDYTIEELNCGVGPSDEED